MTALQDATGSRYHTLSVVDVIDETSDARSFVFALPDALRDAYQYQPGQFLTLRLPWNDDFLLRCYSMSSSPVSDELPKVTVKRVADGRASNLLCDQIKVGDQIEVMRPAGLFVPKRFDDNFLLCAGGSGITPVYSILKTALEQGRGRIRLIYANRDEASIIFREQLKELTQRYSDRLEVIHLLDSVQGIPSETLLASLARGIPGAKAFICGPGPFMDAMEHALELAGYAPGDIHIERFNSLPSEKEAESLSVRPEVDLDFTESEVSIELDGEQYQIRCGTDETILEAAERSELTLPFSCKVGMCASCMCEVKSGDVALLINDVLDDRDLNRGLTLTCQAVPRSPTLALKFS